MTGPRGRTTAPICSLDRLCNDETGFSLVEELVSISLVAVGLVLLLAMISTGTAGVTVHRDRMVAQGLARSQLELVKDAAYQADPTAVPYPQATPPAGFTVQVSVEYWNPGAQSFTTAMNGSGLQRITASVSRDGAALLELTDLKGER